MLDVKIPIFDAVGTGENITKLRKQKHLSVREIQEVFGFETPQAIYKWQHGSAMPTIVGKNPAPARAGGRGG